MSERSTGELLRLRGISKKFGSKVALENIDLDVEAGEVHVICGENADGKSTLMNILAGILEPDQGEIFLRARLSGSPIRLPPDAPESAWSINILSSFPR